MKNGKNPTRTQREIMQEYRLNSNNWLIVKDTTNELHIINRNNFDSRVLNKIKKQKSHL